MFEVLASGNASQIINWGSDLILKRYLPYYNKEYVSGIADRQRAVHATGLPVPEVADVLESEGCWGIVMEKVPTTQLDAVLVNPRELLDTLISLQHEIHQHSAALPPIKPQLEQSIYRGKLPLDTMAVLLRELKGLPDEDALCHMNLRPRHILGDGKRWWIIDWGSAVSGHSRADICRTWMYLAIDRIDTAEMYRQRWTAFGKHYFDDWLPILAAARLSENHPSMEDVLLRKWARL